MLVRSEVTATVPLSRGWSGEAGGSGHPLMTPQAILAAASNFQNCIAQLWPQAARRGVSWQTFQAHTANLEPDLHIMDLLDAQPEFTKSLWDYLDLLVNDARIARGREILATYQPTFAAVELPFASPSRSTAAVEIGRRVPSASTIVWKRIASFACSLNLPPRSTCVT